MKLNLTEKEKSLLTAIVNSEYQDGDPINNHVWLDYIVDTKSRGGVLASLLKKGLVVVNIVAKADSDNKQNGISDSTVAVTKEGMTAYSDDRNIPAAPKVKLSGQGKSIVGKTAIDDLRRMRAHMAWVRSFKKKL